MDECGLIPVIRSACQATTEMLALCSHGTGQTPEKSWLKQLAVDSHNRWDTTLQDPHPHLRVKNLCIP